jgi:enamine deaminase RidA (YjgF/YER057c/UK114 family)
MPMKNQEPCMHLQGGRSHAGVATRFHDDTSGVTKHTRGAATQMNAERRIKELDIELPSGSTPAGNYAVAVQSGNLLFLSGKSPLPVDGKSPKGRLGLEYSTEQGYALARSACTDLLAAMKKTLGSLDRIARVVELHGSINCNPEFEEHAQVLDGASDLLVAVFGTSGVHARSVIGVSSLRNGVPLTVKATVEVKQG